MKIFQNWTFNLILLLIFFFLLVTLHCIGPLIGITNSSELIAEAILMLVATMIGISIPLYVSFANERERRKDEMTSLGRYVGNEILDNIIELEDLQANNKKTIGQLEEKYPNMPGSAKRITLASIWNAAAEDLVLSLDDKHHKSMVSSGIVGRIPDDKVAAGVGETYQKMDNLRKRLRRMSIFLSMLLSPPRDIPPDILKYNLTEKLDESINAVELDIKIFKEKAEETTAELNKLLKPYGKELKIVSYEEEKRKIRERIGKTEKASGEVTATKSKRRKNS